MKFIFLQWVAILNMGFVVWADDTTTLMPLNQVADAKQKLEAFEKGAITLKELTENDGDAGRQELIQYYLSHTNDVSIKAKLAISRCFVISDKYPQAAQLATEYLQVYSNDWHGWKILGGANLTMGNDSAAVAALAKSARLGDEYSYAPLAFAALKIDRLDIVSNLVHHLLVLKKQEPPPEAVPLDIVTVLTIYSLKADQKDVFIKALEGVSAKQILTRDDLPQGVKAGCERFKGKDIDNIRMEMKAAAGNNSNSSNTNNPSPN